MVPFDVRRQLPSISFRFHPLLRNDKKKFQKARPFIEQLAQKHFYIALPVTTLWNANRNEKREVVTISFITSPDTLDSVPNQRSSMSIMNEESILKIIKLSSRARLPTEGTIGFDLYSAYGYRIPAKGK